jgi:hypothetical protein
MKISIVEAPQGMKIRGSRLATQKYGLIGDAAENPLDSVSTIDSQEPQWRWEEAGNALS